MCVSVCVWVYITAVSALPVLYLLIRFCSEETAHHNLYMKLIIWALLGSFFMKKWERFGRSDSGSVLICLFIRNHSCGAFLSLHVWQLCFVCCIRSTSHPFYHCFILKRLCHFTNAPVTFHTFTILLLLHSGFCFFLMLRFIFCDFAW